MEKQFNLIDSPWVKVVTKDLEEKEVSLRDAILRAHEYRDLAGESEPQNISMIRLMVTILYSVFSEKDGYGKDAPVEDMEGAVARWKELWDRGQFPRDPVAEYLDRYHDRFWLFDDEKPFYQANHRMRGTVSEASHLNGTVNQSGSKPRLFPMRTGKAQSRLTPPEAARWLVCAMNFEDMAAKPTNEKSGRTLAKGTVAWMGLLSPVYVSGTDLFRTLMLNLTLLKNGSQPWPRRKKEYGWCAVWELDKLPEEERVQVSPPKTLPGLYTLQSRRFMLGRYVPPKKSESKGSLSRDLDDGFVTGYAILTGDVISNEDRKNYDVDQMSLMFRKKTKNAESIVPMNWPGSGYLWKEFSAIAASAGEDTRPGVVKWVNTLQGYGALDGNEKLRLRATKVEYGSNNSCYGEVHDDNLSFSAGLLAGAKDEGLRQLIINEIEGCDRCAFYISQFAVHIQKALGISKAKQKEWDDYQVVIKRQFFDRVDRIIKRWFYSLDPAADNDEAVRELKSQIIRTARRMGDEIAAKAGDRALIGRTITEKGSDKKTVYCSPRALNELQDRLSKEEKDE